MVVENYNIKCDKCAKEYTQTTKQCSTNFNNPAIPEVQPHLRI